MHLDQSSFILRGFLKCEINTNLNYMPKVKILCYKEEESSMKKKYFDAFKKLKK